MTLPPYVTQVHRLGARAVPGPDRPVIERELEATATDY
jgi:hypothetical protein